MQCTESNRTKRRNAKIVLKIILFYIKVNILIVSNKRACDKSVELFEKNAKKI